MKWVCKNCGTAGEVEEITTSVSCTNEECRAYIVWDESEPCPFWYTAALDELENVCSSSRNLKVAGVLLSIFATVMSVINFRLSTGDLFFFNWGICVLTGVLALLIETGRNEWCRRGIMALSAAGAVLTIVGFFKEMTPAASLFGLVLFGGVLIFSRRRELFTENAPVLKQFLYLLNNRKSRQPVTLEKYQELAGEKKRLFTIPMLFNYLFIIAALITGGWQAVNFPSSAGASPAEIAAMQSPVQMPDVNDPQAFFEYCLAGAEAGNPDMMIQLAQLYLTGQGTEKNAGTAVLWLKRAAEAGSFGARVNLAVCYFQGIGCERDPAKGAAYALEVVGEVPQISLFLAKYYLGHFNDFKVIDPAAAFRYSTLAARTEEIGPGGKYCLAICNAGGYGCPVNGPEAIRLAMEAAVGGDREAQMMIGLVFQQTPVLYE